MHSKSAITTAVSPRTRKPSDKRPLERLHERIATRDRGWFFAQIAEKVATRRAEISLSQRELAELVGTTQSAIARLERGGRSEERRVGKECRCRRGAETDKNKS